MIIRPAMIVRLPVPDKAFDSLKNSLAALGIKVVLRVNPPNSDFVPELIKQNCTHIILADSHLPSQETVQSILHCMHKNPWAVIGIEGEARSRLFSYTLKSFGISVLASGIRGIPLFYLQNATPAAFSDPMLLSPLARAVRQGASPIAVQSSASVSCINPNWASWWAALCYAIYATFFPARPPIEEKKQRAWNGKTRGGFVGYYVMAFLCKSLGLRVAYFCLYFVVPYFMLFAPKARKASLEFWQTLYPRLNYWELQGRVFHHFFTLGILLIDRHYQTLFAEPQFNTYTEEGIDQVKGDWEQGRGLVLVGAHVGARELAANYLLRRGFAGGGLVKSEIKVGPRPLEDKQGPESLPINLMQTPILDIKMRLEAGETLAMMGDRPLGNQYELVPFLGKLALFDITPYRIALSCNVPILVFYAFKTDATGYSFFAKRPTIANVASSSAEKSLALTLQFVEGLESYVRRFPYQWQNFYPFFSHVPDYILRPSPIASSLSITSEKRQSI